MRNLSFLLIALSCLFISCKKNQVTDQPSAPEGNKPIFKSKLSGFVEKGPFIKGSKVLLIDLNSDFSPTGKTFETTITNDLGAFQLNDVSLTSQYVKISVDGFYFNEVTGKLSDSRIILTAIADIKDVNTLNVNILSHLESGRVLSLVKGGTISFSDAKKQAERELLTSFGITENLGTSSEQIRITDDNLQANILLAISSLLISDPNHSDASFTELLATLGQELETSGNFSEKTKTLLTSYTKNLFTSSIIENMIKRYENLGVTVKLTGFAEFVKTHSLGSDAKPSDAITDNNPDVKLFWTGAVRSYATFIENYYVFETLYSHSKTVPDLVGTPLASVYNQAINKDNEHVNVLWSSSYQTILRLNNVINLATKANDAETEDIVKQAIVLRANLYQTMTGLWGDLPYLTIVSIDPSPRRDNIELIRNNSISDINSVLEGLKHEKLNNVFSTIDTKAFAEGTLVRFYLENKDYDKVRTLATNLINNGNFELTPLEQIFSAGSKESFGQMTNNEIFQTSVFKTIAKKGDFVSLMRFTEIVLAAAEANLKTNNYTAALKLVNSVRVRNGRSKLETTSKEDLLNAIINEYKLDLGQEGVYFAALKRNGLAEQVLGLKAYQLLLPIPRNEVSLNQNMVQNPGY